MLRQLNPHVLSFRSAGVWALGYQAPTPHRTFIHAERCPTSEYVRRYNVPTCSRAAGIMPRSKYGKYSWQYILLLRGGQLNANGIEVLGTNLVSQSSHDAL